ncbi:MAG: BON domain-containing protein [Pirellulales bacterium]
MPDVSTIKLPATTTTPADIAQQRLRQSPYFYLKSLSCRFDSGVLTLQGRVPYLPLRHVAEAIVARVDGVQRVANEVEVIDPGYSFATAAPAVRTAG